MKKNSKKLLATLLTVILTALTVSVPAYAQSGTLGTETPSLTAAFTDAAGNTVNGNTLETGDYTVSIMLSGMKTVSIFELTAIYTADLTVNSVATLADTNTSFSVGANVNEDNSIIVILASENDDSSAVADGEVMITMQVTVNTPGDFADFFKVQSDPEVTFIEADYGDGFEAAYVLNADGNEETQTQFPYITVDMSPDAYSVAGQITIATDINGNSGTDGIIGITASVDVNGVTVSDTSDENGYYTLTGIPEGTYTMVISGPTTVDRNVTLVVTSEKAVNGSITVSSVPICVCDYVKNGKIDSYDKTIFFTAFNGEYNVYCDLLLNSEINSYDKTIFYQFFDADYTETGSDAYSDVTL